MSEPQRIGAPQAPDDYVFPSDDWRQGSAPGRSWLVEGAFMRGTVALLSSDGGLGKSLLMQQLCTCASLGIPWLGRKVEKCRAYALFCEDDREELRRRQEDINRHYGCGMKDLRLAYRSRPGLDNLLCTFERWQGQAKATALFRSIEADVLSVWPKESPLAEMTATRLVVLDTASDVFGGNEIARDQVRSFISLLRRLAIAMQGVVILTAHVSNEGLASGSGLAGNRAWSNSVRSRLYLTEGRARKKGEEAPENERMLKGMKNNYGARGEALALRWRAGVFEVMEPRPVSRGSWGELDEEIPF